MGAKKIATRGGDCRWYFRLRGFNGDKIRIGCLTPAFSGAHKRAGMLRNPCVLGTPTKETNQNWLHVICLCIVDSW